jgi:hypothetical protein
MIETKSLVDVGGMVVEGVEVEFSQVEKRESDAA